MPGLILHHYDTSPFSEKVRIVLGMKGLNWRSVTVPVIAPKPELTPLTGGYRRTPVLQVGCDVYIDTQLMLAEIERRFPEPKLVRSGMDWVVNQWADRQFFQTTVPIIFGAIGEHVPAAFIKDREQLSGRPFDPAAMRAAAPAMRAQWRAQAGWIESGLASAGGDWLGGGAPRLADAAAYMNFWFLGSSLPELMRELIAGYDRLPAWLDRMAAVGHGHATDMTGSEALAVSSGSDPEPSPPHDEHDPLGLVAGDPVFVMADDYGRDRVEGRLVAANPERIVLSRDDAAAGTVRVHFPRTGYVAGRA
jgi:glutathione S-transferase